MNRTHETTSSLESMSVLLVSTSYPADAGDWRGIFIRHLVSALSRQPGLKLAVWAPPGELPEATTSVTTETEKRWLKSLMEAGGISHLMRRSLIRKLTAPLYLLNILAAAFRRHRAADIYHLNWLQCALPLPSDGKPALITVLGNDLNLLRLPFMGRLLRRTMLKRNVAICPNAEWMAAPLRERFGDVAEVVPVSFGIDPLWYAITRNYDPSSVRRWLVVTRLTANKVGTLFEWSKPLFLDGFRELHLFGPKQEDGVRLPEWVRYHGAVTSEELAEIWFPTACGLITLSRHSEGRPQVMLEAMAAGLPIVASRMPAHATIVDDGRTGLLCDSPESFAFQLVKAEDPAANQDLGNAARRKVTHEIGDWDDCARRYTQIYRRLLGNDELE